MNLVSKSRKWNITYTCISINISPTTISSSTIMPRITTLRPLILNGGPLRGQIRDNRLEGMVMLRITPSTAEQKLLLSGQNTIFSN